MHGQVSRATLDALRAQVDGRLSELMPDAGDPPHRLHAAMSYALLTPGKRLRPMLTLLTATSLGADGARALDAACAVEMVHAASLVLDDLPCMDNADLRRGQPTTFRRYGEDVAILAAVALLNQAFAVLAQSGALDPAASVQMVRALSAAVGVDGLVAGQESDLRRNEDLSAARLSQINRRKTAVLFEAAVEIGAHVAGASKPQVVALRCFALQLGLAFQAIDDLDDAETGEDSQPTLVSVLGREGARAEALERLESARNALKAVGRTLEVLDSSVELLLERVMVRS